MKHYWPLHSVCLRLLSSQNFGPQRLLPYLSAKKVALSTACSAICFIDLFAPRFDSQQPVVASIEVAGLSCHAEGRLKTWQNTTPAQ